MRDTHTVRESASDAEAPRSESGRGGRRGFLQAVAALGIGATATATVGGGAAGSSSPEIDSCTTITEPGEYELVADVEPDSVDGTGCIEVVASDVTLRGNGHAIDGSAVDSVRGGLFGAAGVSVRSPGSFGEAPAGVTVEDLHVREFPVGVRFEESSNNRVSGATASGHAAGIVLAATAQTEIEDSRVHGSPTGIYLWGDPDVAGGPIGTHVGHNLIDRNEQGIRLGFETSGNEIVANRILKNERGVAAGRIASEATLRRNNLCKNAEYGVFKQKPPEEQEEEMEQHPGPAIDAIGNYWSAADGPSSFGDPPEPFADPETGRSADGSGDAVSESAEPGVANVRFDPFIDAPVDDAGRRS